MAERDPRPVFGRTADQFARVLAAAPVEAMGWATPCDDFDVRALCGHVLAVERRITHVVNGGNAADTPHVVDGVSDTDWGGEVRDTRAALDDALADDVVLDGVRSWPFGTMPTRAALTVFSMEITAHSWDLAAAIGRTDLLDDELAEISLAVARAGVPAEPRAAGMPFGPVVEVPPDAGPYAHLAGYLGRHP